MIAADRFIINGLRDVDRCYTAIMRVFANASIRTNDPIGAALTVDDQLALAGLLVQLGQALAARGREGWPVTEGSQGEVER